MDVVSFLARGSEIMSCEESAVYFVNIAGVPQMIDNRSTFQHIATKINPKESCFQVEINT